MKRNLIIFIGFWLFFFVCTLIATPIENFLLSDSLSIFELSYRSAIRLRSEYAMDEQLSKFYLFIILLISILSYQNAKEPLKIKQSICFFMLAWVIYSAESNMIVEDHQPIFGGIIFLFIYYYLYQTKSWLTMGLFTCGLCMIASGDVMDVISHFDEDHHGGQNQDYLIFVEERLDVLGIGFLCLSAIMHFCDPLFEFCKSNQRAILLLLGASALITIGNGLLHFQYSPNNYLKIVGNAFCMLGFFSFVFVNKGLSKKGRGLSLLSEDYLYLFIFSFFVLLPSIFRWNNVVFTWMVWLPSWIAFAMNLWFQKKGELKSML